MTDHVYEYVECDRYTVLWEHPLWDYHPDESKDDFEPYNECYCGSGAEYIARVGFHTDLEPSNGWPRSLLQDLKVHRCPEHRFKPTEDN